MPELGTQCTENFDKTSPEVWRASNVPMSQKSKVPKRELPNSVAEKAVAVEKKAHLLHKKAEMLHARVEKTHVDAQDAHMRAKSLREQAAAERKKRSKKIA